MIYCKLSIVSIIDCVNVRMYFVFFSLRFVFFASVYKMSFFLYEMLVVNSIQMIRTCITLEIHTYL